MSNNGIPPLDDWQADNYPVIFDEGASQLQYVKTGTKVDVPASSSYLVATVTLTNDQIKALPTTNIELVPSQGVNKVIIPFCVIFYAKNMTNAYTGISGFASFQIFIENSGNKVLYGMRESINGFVSALLSPSDSYTVVGIDATTNPITSLFANQATAASTDMGDRLLLGIANSGINLGGGDAATTLLVRVLYTTIDL